MITSVFWPNPNHLSELVAGAAIAVLDIAEQQVKPGQLPLDLAGVADVLP